MIDAIRDMIAGGRLRKEQEVSFSYWGGDRRCWNLRIDDRNHVILDYECLEGGNILRGHVLSSKLTEFIKALYEAAKNMCRDRNLF